MRLIPSDPDIATITGRISRGELDLQPNFQRGEVWSVSKKQKLIDSILREWHIPPVHIIQGPDGAEDEVLDGQQRLAAIRDFLDDRMPINGEIEPFDETIYGLDGLFFSMLPIEWKRKILRFPIRVFSIIDFLPAEPSELFYRLNQPASLTAAEQRNSFFGRPREQIKALVVQMEAENIDKTFLGFSNSRMAYDDVLARVCVALEVGLGEKLSATLLADRYRSGEPFHETAYYQVQEAINSMASVREITGECFRLNKASLFSWLIFFCRLKIEIPNIESNRYASFFYGFEYERTHRSLISNSQHYTEQLRFKLFQIYNDRVTSRVADVSSVILRDTALWGIFVIGYSIPELAHNRRLHAFSDFLLHNLSFYEDEIDKPLLDFAQLGTNWSTIL